VIMLSPSDGIEGQNRVVEWVKRSVQLPAGRRGCGRGAFEEVALTARKLFCAPWGRRTRTHNGGDGGGAFDQGQQPGHQTRGWGRITALAVNVELIPCHIASFPMAVNLNCHAHRHQEAVI
jgi:fumarate hydratase subunit alpha